jgi:hypothetical protein
MRLKLLKITTKNVDNNMTMKRIIIILLILIPGFYLPGQTINPGKSLTPTIEIDISGCSGVFDVLTAMRNGVSKENISVMLDSLLQTKPYQAMFRHYNRSWRPNHLPVPVFKRMILSLRFKESYSKGENERADQMFPFWVKFYSNLPLFRKNLDQLRNLDLRTEVSEAVTFASSWLPHEWRIPDFYLPIHPNGSSRAFSIDTVQGYDFFQLPRDTLGNILWKQLIGTFSHESHHLGIKTIYPAEMNASDSVAYTFLSIFVGEGTANKFINNYPGGYVPAVDNSKDSSFDNLEVKKWWERYSKEEAGLFKRLVTTFERAYAGTLSAKELQTEISQFWLSGYLSPVYFVGSELFGAIYHGHGKEGAFDAMTDLRKVFLLYNEAIKRRPGILGRCLVIPDSTVQHALMIGNR